VSIATLGCTASADAAATRLLSNAEVVADNTFNILSIQSQERCETKFSKEAALTENTLQYQITQNCSGDTVTIVTFTCRYLFGEQYQLVGARQRTYVNVAGYILDNEYSLENDGANPACPPSE
jgi:hypothetical protein